MKKFICALFGLMAFAGTLSVSAQSVEKMSVKSLLAPTEGEIDIWVDHAAEEFAGGSGTEADPYKIQNAAQLAKIAHDMFWGEGKVDFADTYFVIENDIDMEGHTWFPIGFSAEEVGLGEVYFGGKINGRGHKILNMVTQTVDGFKGYGLFGETSEKFELKNLIIESGNIEGTMVLGAFVGHNRGLVENCINKVDVSCLMFYAGGIVGSNTTLDGKGVVRHCQNYGNVSAGIDNYQGYSAGGIVGSNSSLIEECVNWGTVNGNSNGAGGIVGMLEGGTVTQCINRGDVKAPEQVGGLIATALGRSGNCVVKNNYSTGNVTSDAGVAAGSVVGIAMFQNMNTLTLTNNYYDSSICSGPAVGSLSDFFSKFVVENNTGMSTDDMKSADFVTTLVNESEGKNVWLADEKNLNDGYPVLEFMLTPLVGVEEQVADKDGVAVSVIDGHIVLNGVEEAAAVEVYGINGMRVFGGAAAELGYISLEKGIYVLRAEDKTYKVCVR